MKKHMIIGTAGHVDHGKTSLIQALTGINADRLKEEQKRGITIDLGFAYIDLEGFPRVGIVDVPGHERFIKNMLAGAGGIDLALMVIAADEGVMPQTREHLDILRMLGMKYGVIAVTKVDLVEEEYLELVEEDIRDAVAGSFLENAPICFASSYTGEGIETLRQTLARELAKVETKNEAIPFRIPIDRSFSIRGFGTVVTGTLIEGKLKPEQDVCLYPEGNSVRIRGVQVHSVNVGEAYAGQRVAVNLAGLKKEDCGRGHVLAPVGSLIPTMMIDVRLELLKTASFEVKNNSRVHFYHGSGEYLAKVVLLDRVLLKPSESCYAQLRFQENIVVKKWDRFVIRFYSPVETIGGGIVLDQDAVKKRRNQVSVLHGLEIKEKGTNEERLLWAIQEFDHSFLTVDELIRKACLDRSQTRNQLKKYVEAKEVISLPGDRCLSAKYVNLLKNRLIAVLKKYHKEEPLKEGMPIQEARSRLLPGADSRMTDELLNYFKGQKVIKEQDARISLYAFKVERQETEEQIAQMVEKIYLEAGYAVPAMDIINEQFKEYKPYKRVFTMMLKEGILVKLDDRYCMHKQFLADAEKSVCELGAQVSVITLGEYRDRLDASRKVALALLEYFDRMGVTKRQGEGRMINRDRREG